MWAFRRASTASEMYFRFKRKKKSLRLVSKVSLLTLIITGEADYQNKKSQCRVKKSKITLVTSKESLLEKEEQLWISSDYRNLF